VLTHGRICGTHGAGPIIQVRDAKGGKSRPAPIPSSACAAIEHWLKERTAALGVPGQRDPSFVRPDGAPMNQQGIDRQLRGPANRIGVIVPDGAMAHALRHSYGDRLARRGVWPCPLPVEKYVAAGRDVAVLRLSCPGCSKLMMFWSGYERSVRVGGCYRLWIVRARCLRCRTSHALLPNFALVGPVGRGRHDRPGTG